MIVTTGDGKIIKNLDRDNVIAEFKYAQKHGDKFCSVTGAYAEGYDPDKLMREAGYTISATEKEVYAALSRKMSMIGRKGGSSKSPAKQKSSRENGKLGGRPKIR